MHAQCSTLKRIHTYPNVDQESSDAAADMSGCTRSHSVCGPELLAASDSEHDATDAEHSVPVLDANDMLTIKFNPKKELITFEAKVDKDDIDGKPRQVMTI